jgi:hypothetical protein
MTRSPPVLKTWAASRTAASYRRQTRDRPSQALTLPRLLFCRTGSTQVLSDDVVRNSWCQDGWGTTPQGTVWESGQVSGDLCLEPPSQHCLSAMCLLNIFLSASLPPLLLLLFSLWKEPVCPPADCVVCWLPYRMWCWWGNLAQDWSGQLGFHQPTEGLPHHLSYAICSADIIQ